MASDPDAPDAPDQEAPSGPQTASPEDPQTGIIRRHPSGEIPVGSDEALGRSGGTSRPKGRGTESSDPQTSIIRRHPTGAIPVVDLDPTQLADQAGATQVANQVEPQTSYIPRARPTAVAPTRSAPSPRAAMAAAVLSILTGWTTAVIATDLITAWWQTDRLFCIAVGFLTLIAAAALISGLIGLLLRRWVSRLLIVVGAVVALLIFSSLFVAGAKLPAVVYAIPLVPVATIVLAVLPATGRWERSG